MAKILLPIPAAPSLIHRVVIEQGDPRAAVFNALYADLPTDPVSGCLVIDDPAIDNTVDRWLSYESAVGVRSRHPQQIRAEPADADTLSIHVYTIDASLGVVDGIAFGAVPADNFVAAGAARVVAGTKTHTDQTGYAQLTLRGGTGDYNLVLGRLRGRITVTGKTGQDINVKEAGWT